MMMRVQLIGDHQRTSVVEALPLNLLLAVGLGQN